MVCAHCGCDNPDGIAYCRDCGMTLRAPGARVAAPTPTPELAAAAGLIPQPQPRAPEPQPVPMAAPPMISMNGPAVQQPHVSTLRSDQVLPQPNASTDVPCARCGERNPPDSRFCHSCGLAVGMPPPPAVAVQRVVETSSPPSSAAPSSAVCARCRGIADPGADFCKFCGARLGGVDSQSDRKAAPEPAPPQPQVPRSEAPPVRPPLALDLAPPRPAPVLAPQVAPSVPPGPHGPPGPFPPQAHAPVAIDPPGIHGSTRPLHGIGEIAARGRLVRIAKDGSEGAHHPIALDVTDIGRSEGNIVLPDDPYLSPRHARIALRHAGGDSVSLVLIDLGSVNGVFVRIRAPHPLTHGDLLLLGQQVLRFEAVTEIEGARGPAMQHGVLLFGSPAPVTRARLLQRTVEGLSRDVLYVVRDELVVGREGGDRTFPEDVFMSRRHAAVRRDASGWVLHDLGSSNGTFVQIHAEHVLRDGDQFRIGHHLFRVDIPAPGGAA